MAPAISDDHIGAAVAAQEPWMVSLLERLVAAPTTLGREETGQAIMRSAFSELGLAPVDIALDAQALRSHPHASPFSWDVSGKANVTATWAGRGSGGRSLILNGHVDVVPPAAAELWSRPPFAPWRDGDWLYGRGAGDMKAGLVAIAGAVRALSALGAAPRADVHLQSVVEEECTGNGTLQCCLVGPRADGCVITEPYPDAITIAQLGVVWLHVDIRGRPGHAASASEVGVNAIEAAAAITHELRDLEAELNVGPPSPFDVLEHPINLNPGMIHGGDWTSTVAAQCTISYRLALYPEQEPEQLHRQVREAIERATAQDPFLAQNPPTIRFDGFSCEGYAVSPQEPVAATLSDTHQRLLGYAPVPVASTATTDARHFVRYGISTVCFGPLAQEIHGIDERVSIASIRRTATVLAAFIQDWCGLVT